MHMFDQRVQTIWVFAWIDGPVGQATRVVVAIAEPAIIQHEALCAKR